MRRDLFKQDLTRFDWNPVDQAEFFDEMATRAEKRGYVRDTFLDAIKAREAKFPTALPTQPEAIAIPHADAEHIIEPFIAPVRLKSPVAWNEMGNDEVEHSVRFIFMLGFTKSDAHIEVLQLLLQNFQDPEFMKALDSAVDEDEFYKVVAAMQGLED